MLPKESGATGLRQARTGFAIGRDLAAAAIPPVSYATSDVALVRFHGRSASRWKKQTPSASERFRYLYKTAELREWATRIEQLAERTESVHVLMNNCYSDYAVRNARQMIELLGEAKLSRARAARPTARAASRRATAP